MKVAFNARLLADSSLRGWNRYTVNLLAELTGLGVRAILCSDRPIHQAHLARLCEGSYEVRVSPVMNYFLWEQRWLPRQCAADRVDLLHCPFNFGLPWSCPCPRILTLHDAIDALYYRTSRPWHDQITTAAMKSRLFNWIARTRAEHIITVSNHARRDLVDRMGVPEGRITVVYEAADERFAAPIDAEMRQCVRHKYGLSRPYVLYVGGWEERKNVPFLLKAFAVANLPEVDLVLAGGKDQQRDSVAPGARDLGILPRTRLLGWVDDDDLPALYAEALCFVYPSMYEGFGLQLCEAMAAGCPVLAANATCLPEILGDGGETFSLTNPSELAGQLRRICDCDGFRRELSCRGMQRASQFSWHVTARRTEELYRAVLEQKGIV